MGLRQIFDIPSAFFFVFNFVFNCDPSYHAFGNEKLILVTFNDLSPLRVSNKQFFSVKTAFLCETELVERMLNKNKSVPQLL